MEQLELDDLWPYLYNSTSSETPFNYAYRYEFEEIIDSNGNLTYEDVDNDLMLSKGDRLILTGEVVLKTKLIKIIFIPTGGELVSINTV